ncbi:hypothetical protein [Thermus brockianus]
MGDTVDAHCPRRILAWAPSP